MTKFTIRKHSYILQLDQNENTTVIARNHYYPDTRNSPTCLLTSSSNSGGKLLTVIRHQQMVPKTNITYSFKTLWVLLNTSLNNYNTVLWSFPDLSLIHIIFQVF